MCYIHYPYSGQNFGMLPLEQIRDDSVYRKGQSAMKLFSKYSNLCDHDTSPSNTDKDRQTDERIAVKFITALCVT